MPDDVPHALGPFTTGCIKLQFPSLRRDAWHNNAGKLAIALNLVEILNVFCVVNMFHTKFFSHVIIGIDHGRSWVTATTSSWLVVWRGRPESAARGMSPPDNKSLGCCCRNSRPTVINPLIQIRHKLTIWTYLDTARSVRLFDTSLGRFDSVK